MPPLLETILIIVAIALAGLADQLYDEAGRKHWDRDREREREREELHRRNIRG